MHRSIASIVALVVAGALAAGAAASPRAADSGAAAASFCSVSKGVAKQVAALGSSLNSAASAAARQATLKAQLTDIKRAEPALKSNVPRSLKPKLTIVVGFVNFAYTKLSAVSWNFAALAAQPKTLAALEAGSTRADPALNTLTTYYRKVCKFRI